MSITGEKLLKIPKYGGWTTCCWIPTNHRRNQNSLGTRIFFLKYPIKIWIQFSSVAQSCPTLCDPMDCSTPGLSVHHQLPEFTQTHEQLHFHLSLSCIGEGNGNPLQYSCLENPRDGEPGGLPSLGSHRVGHNWSDLAAAAAGSVVGHRALIGSRH